MSTITVRKVKPADLPAFEVIRGEQFPKQQKKRIRKQREGAALYLIAFEGKDPVGHVYIPYRDDSPYHYSYPVLQDLYVKKEKRRHGIGRKILRQAEARMRKLGYKKIGIGVEVHEYWIRKFYESAGFAVASEPHTESWTEEDTGRTVTIEVYHMRKDLT